MMDLHNHILPGIDDGAADLSESLAIARQFVSEGVTQIAATPHLDPQRTNSVEGRDVRERVGILQAALSQEDLQLTVVPGQELYLTSTALAVLESGRAITLGTGRGVLVETSMGAAQRPTFLNDILFHLQAAGYRPVLAHPERYPWVQKNPDSVSDLCERGILLQLTAPALLGEYGVRIRRTAERLLRAGWYSLAASDRHHPGQNRSLAHLHDRITSQTSKETADVLLKVNPLRILTDEPIVVPDPAQIVRQGIFERLFGR